MFGLKQNMKTTRAHAALPGVAFVCFALALMLTIAANAEVRDPNSDYENSRVGGRPTTGQGLTAGRGRAAGEPTGLEWVAAKAQVAKTVVIGIMKSIFGSADQPVAPVAVAKRAAQLPDAVVANSESSGRAPSGEAAAPSDMHEHEAAGESISFPGLSRSNSGVVRYDIDPNLDVIPRLRLPREPRLGLERFQLDPRAQRTLETAVFAPLQSADLMSAEESARLLRAWVPVVAPKSERLVTVAHGKVDATVLQKLILKLDPEATLKLAKFVPLTTEEYRFLSGLLLYQNGYKCGAAVGLFHSISSKPEWQSEADYYMAMCSKSLGLMTDFSERVRRVFASGDMHYSRKLLREINADTPNVTTRPFGEALEKAMRNPGVIQGQSEDVLATAAAIIAESAAAAEKFKTALEWAKKVPEKHPRYLQAKFVEALAEYQIGSKPRALEIQEGLIRDPRAEASAREFQGLIALNLARMYFQEQKYKEAHTAFLTVNKDHPLWLQGLTEMGWAQLLSSDFEGAIGNMYSIHSPFFAAAYKPESYVIRTIGYLNLCQYGDAYRTLSILEKDYRVMLSSIDKYDKGIKSVVDGRYGTIRRFLVGFNRPGRTDTKEVDGLPASIIREIARQKDFINLQKALNRQIDERAAYAKIPQEIQRNLAEAQGKVNETRKRIEEIRKKIARIKNEPALEQNRVAWQQNLENEMNRLSDQFFSIDLFNEAKLASAQYQTDVVAGADRRGLEIKGKIDAVIANRILKIRTDLSRFLDNNELLRYEVFSASGENIRYQVAGGEKANRIAANVLPKSKSLQWDFDGEYWEDEIGHYRSSLKNNCPAQGEGHRDTASYQGGE